VVHKKCNFGSGTDPTLLRNFGQPYLRNLRLPHFKSDRDKFVKIVVQVNTQQLNHKLLMHELSTPVDRRTIAMDGWRIMDPEPSPPVPGPLVHSYFLSLQ